jgi:Zn-dependent alcohol dehydrogenase
MKAAVCYEFGEPLVIEEIEIHPPKKGEVKVKLAASAICHSDIHSMDGAWGGYRPVVYGHEASGVVTEVGDGVTTAQVGDHVVVTLVRTCGTCYFCSQGDSHICEGTFPLDSESRLSKPDGTSVKQGVYAGAFAEYVVVEQSQVVTLPKDFPLDCASLLACGVITGFGAVVNTAKMPAGSSAVVIGAGGVGLNSVQGAVVSGAYPVIAIDLLDNKLEAAKTFGATHTINSSQEDARKGVKALTAGRGADYVFVTVGNSKAIEQGMSLIKRGGTVVIVGMPASGDMTSYEPVNFAYDSQTILGSRMGSTKLSHDIPYLVSLYQSGRLKLDELISNRYQLEEINDAIDGVRRGEALRNVIVFD